MDYVYLGEQNNLHPSPFKVGMFTVSYRKLKTPSSTTLLGRGGVGKTALFPFEVRKAL